jgi:hypothetical protein
VPICLLIFTINPSSLVALTSSLLLAMCVPALTAVLRGSAAIELIVLRAESLSAPRVRERAAALRRTRSFAYGVASLVMALWIPIFIAAISPNFPTTPVLTIYLILLPALRAARLLDLCAQNRPPADHEYARRLDTSVDLQPARNG